MEERQTIKNATIYRTCGRWDGRCMNKQYGQDAQALYEAILSLKTADECEHFLEDLCTINEVMDMVQRFHAARLLYAGENYVSVSEKTGMSTATISRVRRCLHYGKDGYLTVLQRMNGQTDTKKTNAAKAGKAGVPGQEPDANEDKHV